MKEETNEPKINLGNEIKAKRRKIYFGAFIGLSIILAIGLLYVVVVAVGLYGFNWRYNFVKKTASIVPYPAGWVGAFPIKFSEVFNEEAPAKKFYTQTGAPVPKEATLEKQAIDFLTRVKIIQQYAAIYRVSVPVKDVNDSLNKLYEENGGKQTFEQILAQYYGYSSSDIYRLVYLSLMQQKLNDYYDGEVLRQAQLSQVLLDKEARAKDILAKAKKGDNFSDLAKNNSLDKKTKDKGGDLGYFTKDNLYKVIAKSTDVDKNLLSDFQNKIWSAKSGDVFMFKTDFGYQVIKVDGFKGTEEKTFEDWLQEKIGKGFVLHFV